MLLKKQGFPEEDELVLCTVTAVQYHSVFVRLDEYHKSGLIHISEIAPGRIRNIRDYVVEGKKVVCKVLRIDKEKGHIDLSLRRVNEMQKRQKLNQIKQEQLSEKIIEYVAKQNKKDAITLYTELTQKIFQKYDSLFEAFELVTNDKLDLSNFTDKKIADSLTEVIKQRIKPPEISIWGELKIVSYAPDGVKKIKNVLSSTEKVEGNPIIKYKGGGIYSLEIKSDDYKTAEKILKKVVDTAESCAKKNKAEFEFIRIDKD